MGEINAVPLGGALVRVLLGSPRPGRAFGLSLGIDQDFGGSLFRRLEHHDQE